ncbi:MAG: hypothetical protein NUW02_02920 [Candidatus Campbellbacteria bacterium]|nr:hypothetical protein [Candidatus Campbellbacteria bacterium]
MRNKQEEQRLGSQLNDSRKARSRSFLVGFILAVVTILLAVIFGSCAAHSQEIEQESAVTFSGGIELWSKYLGSTGGVFHDKPVLQGNMTLLFRSGCYGDLWWSRARGRWLNSYGDEVDITVGCAPNDFIDFGVAYLLVSHLSPSDVGWVYVDLFTSSYKERGWSIKGYLKIDYYWPLQGIEPLAGWNTHLGAEVGKTFGKWSSTSSLEVLHDTGAFGAGEGLVWRASTEIAREVGSLSVGVGVNYSRGINLPDWDDRTGEIATGLFTRF